MKVAHLRRFAAPSLVVLGMTTAAVAQPLFVLLGENATFFVAQGATSGSIILFALAWFLVPPLVVLVVVGSIYSLNQRAGRFVWAASVGILGAIAIAQLLPGDNDWLPLVALAVLIGLAVAIAWLGLTRAPVRDFLALIGVLSPLALLLFLFFTPVKELVLPDDVAAAGAGAARPNQVVAVVFDELALAALLTPDHEIDAAKAPNFARLAQTSTWYRDAITVSSSTDYAVPAILSGRSSRDETLPIAAQYPQNLFTVLAPSHDILASEAVTQLCPTAICEASASDTSGSLYDDALMVYLHTLLPVDLANEWLPSLSKRWTGFSDAPVPSSSAEADPSSAGTSSSEPLWGDLKLDQVDRWNAFIASQATIERPSVSYLHVILPHTPFIYLSDGRRYNGNEGDGLVDYLWSPDQQLVDVAIHAYLHQVEYVDALLGELLDELEAAGRLDETLLVVTADHGVSFEAGSDAYTADPETLSWHAQVPMFIKYPGQTEGQIDDRPTQTIDILPSVADSLGVTLTDPVQGQSLLSEAWEPPRREWNWPEGIDVEASLDLDRAIAGFTNVVPPGVLAARVYGIGGARSLVGGPVTDAELGPPSTIEVSPLIQPYWYSIDDLAHDTLPVRFLATVDGAEPGTHIVIALNGVVAGSGLVTRLPDGEGISLMLDPKALIEGPNVIAAYELEGDTLRPAAVRSPDAFSLRLDSEGRPSSVTLDDRTWAGVDADNLIGIADWRSMREPGAVPPKSLDGFAADSVAGSAWERLLLVEGDQVVTDLFERTARPEIAERYGRSELDYGFHIDLNPAIAARLRDLRVVALFPDGSMQVAD